LGIAVAIGGRHTEFDALAQQSKQDGVLPWVVSGTNGVITDFVAGALTRAAAPSIDVRGATEGRFDNSAKG
jgi:hypothetical protein